MKDIIFLWAIPAIICFLGTFSALECYTGIKQFFRPEQRERRRIMRKGSRERYVKALIADEICRALEGLYFNRKITAREKEEWYVKFANRCHLRDLLPGIPAYNYRGLFDHQEKLKEELRAKHNKVDLFSIRVA